MTIHTFVFACCVILVTVLAPFSRAQGNEKTPGMGAATETLLKGNQDGSSTQRGLILLDTPSQGTSGSIPPTSTPPAFEYGLDVYVVKPGDCLSKIAKKLWGDAFLWPILYGANTNQITNPNLIYPGQKLSVPRLAPAQRQAYGQPAQVPPPPIVSKSGSQPGGVTTKSSGFDRWMNEAVSYAQRTWRFPKVTNKYGQPITHEDYIKAILFIESRGRHTNSSGSVTRSSAGALGFMQLMPETARSMGVDPLDPRQNLLGGVGFLARVFDSPATKVPGDSPADVLVKAAAGYNMGPYSKGLSTQTWDQFVRTSGVRETVRYGITLKMALGLNLSPVEENWIANDKQISISSVDMLGESTYQQAHSLS